MANELVALEKLDPAVVFAPGGIDPILQKIVEEVRSTKTDISTKQGRAEVASLAHKIARSKTFLDEAGKTLGEDAKKKIDAINAERKKARDQLDALKDEVRAPLTEWEEAEDKRISTHEEALKTIELAGVDTATRWEYYPVEAMRDRMAEIQKEFAKTDWQEFKIRAGDVVEKTMRQMTYSIQKREKRDADAAELERLRAETAERQKADDAKAAADREAMLMKEAADKATAEAEARAAAAAKAAADKAAADLAAQKAAEEKAKQDAADAEARAQKAEADRQAAVKKAEDDAKAAAQKAADDQAKAVQAERDRAAASAKAEADAAAKREADKAHRAKINNAAKDAIQKCVDAVVSDSKIAELVVTAIAKGEVPNVKISY